MKERQVEILPCPFCGANPCRIAEKREVVNTETGEAISSNIGITYWKHPETPDCVLGSRQQDSPRRAASPRYGE